jgi:N utilization substance protein A
MPKKLKFTNEMIRYIGLFESLTGAAVKDCLLDDNEIITFIVDEGGMGLAIGKKGVNIKRVKKVLGKNLDILEFSKDPLQFTRNLISPTKPISVYLSEKSSGEKVINIHIDKSQKKNFYLNKKKGLCYRVVDPRIMRNLLEIIQRHYPIDDIVLKY